MADSTGFGLKDIEYLVNGEYASGSNNTSSSAGVLNRPLAQIDANVRLLAGVLAHQHNSDGSLKDSSVVTSMLDDGAVTEGKLGSSSVTSGKIKDGAITASKLASNSVSNAKIANNSVTPAKTNFNSAVAMSSIEFSKTTSSSGHGGAIDFHYNGSTSDYTSRIIESASGKLAITARNGLYLNGKELGVSSAPLVYTNSFGTWTETKLSDGSVMLEGTGQASIKSFNVSRAKVIYCDISFPKRIVTIQSNAIGGTNSPFGILSFVQNLGYENGDYSLWWSVSFTPTYCTFRVQQLNSGVFYETTSFMFQFYIRGIIDEGGGGG